MKSTKNNDIPPQLNSKSVGSDDHAGLRGIDAFLDDGASASDTDLRIDTTRLSPCALTAAVLLRSHNSKARQVVVSRMIEAIQAHDMELAHFWDEVGQRVDDMIRAATPPRHGR